MKRATKRDIIRRMNRILNTEWPKIHTLAKAEDCDKAVPPYFVVEVLEKPAKKELNLWFYDYTVIVTYNPKVFDQRKQLDMADRIEELVGMIFSANGRNLTVEEWESEFLDIKLTQCRFRLRETVNAVKAEVEPLMEDLDAQIKGGTNE